MIATIIVQILTIQNKNETVATVVTTFESTTIPETPEITESLDELEIQVQEYLDGCSDGNWAVYVKDESTGLSFSINDSQMVSASLIKLFVAGCYYEQVENGLIKDNDYNQELLYLMISQSDNDAWEEIETIIGKGNYEKGIEMVTDFCHEHGYENSGRLYYEGYWNQGGEEPDNTTSVSDIGNVLDSIYNGTYVSTECSYTIMEYMLDQIKTNKIPSGLPEGTKCANKTGELNTVENDAAIISTSKTDYILVVMSEDDYDTELVQNEIVELSTLVYNYFEETN